MRRVHLFEFEDQKWLPGALRRFATDYLRAVQSRLALHRPLARRLAMLLTQADTEQIVDLCSGSGGALPDVVAQLRGTGMDARVLLTDRFPNHDLPALPEGVRMHVASIDARDVPPELPGCRTMFNAFHHFMPHDARRVLQCAVDAGQSIGIFEIAERRPRNILAAMLIPLAVLVMTPLVRPFRWSRLALTYVVPLVPVICWWDGFVSQLRAYTRQELGELADALAADSYIWTCGCERVGGALVRITYLTGVPAAGSKARPIGGGG